jgi:hypothetical protein
LAVVILKSPPFPSASNPTSLEIKLKSRVIESVALMLIKPASPLPSVLALTELKLVKEKLGVVIFSSPALPSPPLDNDVLLVEIELKLSRIIDSVALMLIKPAFPCPSVSALTEPSVKERLAEVMFKFPPSPFP